MLLNGPRTTKWSEQGSVVKAYIQQLNDARVFGAPIVTTIEEGREFYRAEAYHQDFFERNPSHPTSSSTICRRSPRSNGRSRAVA